jgi:RNA polymerase sigma factor (sigma-70 family)
MDETATRTLDGEALAGIERSLHGKLRAHHISDSFFDRYGEDAVQKGLVEYLRATADGVEVQEPRAFVLQAAFRRAIDELRREARRADGDALEQVLESGRSSAPPAEDEAIANIEAGRLQEAIDSLSLEERRILALHYFEEVGQRRGAELLFMSERTFRRRLKRAQAHLARLLGAPTAEPDTHRGVEIGLAAWAGLGGGRAVVASGAAGHLVAALESARAGAVRLLDRFRGPGTRLATSEAPERFGAIAGGPAGKVVGGCAGAAVVCVLSGVVGPGLDLGGGPNTARPVSTHHIAAAHALRRPLHQIILDPQGQSASRLRAAEPAETHDTSPSPREPAARHRHPDTEQREAKKAEKAPPPTAEGRTQVVEEGQSRREEFGAFGGRGEQSTAEPEAEAEPPPSPAPEPGNRQTAVEESATTSPSSEANRQFGFGR